MAKGRGENDLFKYFTILAREFPDWVGLNVIFLLTSLPLFTIGPALSALGQVLTQMAQGHSGSPIRRYWAAFRSDFPRKVGYGLAFTLLSTLLLTAIWFYFTAGGLLFSLAGVSLAGLICLWALGAHLFPALSAPRPPERPLSAAAAGVLGSFARTLGAVLAALALAAVQLLLFPALLPLTLAGGGVLPCLALSLAAVGEDDLGD